GGRGPRPARPHTRVRALLARGRRGLRTGAGDRQGDRRASRRHGERGRIALHARYQGVVRDHPYNWVHSPDRRTLPMRPLPPQPLALAAAVIVGLAVGAAGIAQAVGGGSPPPPKPLAQAIYDAANAPDPQGISARIHFTNHLLPAGTLGQGNTSPV